MNKKQLQQVIARMEHHLECWKQFNDFMALARAKKFNQENETQFLEIKCVLTQELELIVSALENLPTTREEVHTLISAAPSIRYLSELNENNLRTLENQWHKMFMNWQAVLGQLKVRQDEIENQSVFRRWFGSASPAKAVDK